MEPITESTAAVADEKPKRKPVYAKREQHSHEHAVSKPSDVTMPPLGHELPSGVNTIQAVESPLNKDYLDELQFNEDPIAIYITPSSEKFAPRYVECWVNGKGIEVLIGNKWVEFKAVPVAKQLVTKRKYVEVLLRNKRTDIKTHIENPNDPEPRNVLERTDALIHGISIRHDPSPKGAEWLNRMVSLQ